MINKGDSIYFTDIEGSDKTSIAKLSNNMIIDSDKILNLQICKYIIIFINSRLVHIRYKLTGICINGGTFF